MNDSHLDIDIGLVPLLGLVIEQLKVAFDGILAKGTPSCELGGRRFGCGTGHGCECVSGWMRSEMDGWGRREERECVGEI